MPTREIITPSGLSGVIRNLQGSELNILSDEQARSREETFDKILRNCWQSTSAGGQLESQYLAGGSVQWDRVLVDDSFYVLVQIVCLTWSQNYPFFFTCEACEKRQEWEVEIDKDIHCKPFPSGSIERYRETNKFPIRMPGGAKGTFRLTTRADAKDMQRLIEKATHDRITYALGNRIIEVEGIEKEKRWDYFEEMNLPDQLDLIDDLDRVGAGYDDRIEVQCQEARCSHHQEVRIPFDGRFWIRRRKPRLKRD